MSKDTREELANWLELFAAQVREHGVLPGWDITSSAESVEVPNGIYMNREPTGLFHHTVKFDIDRSVAWRCEELNRV
jgi:hypothetical protein